MDHSEGLADKGLAAGQVRRPRGFRGGGGEGRVGAKSIGLFTYKKMLDGNGVGVNCEVGVFPLLVKRQSETWPEIEQRVVQWVAPDRALSLIKDPGLKALVAAFVKRMAVAASKSTP